LGGSALKKLNVKVEHIYHSSFTVETENYFLVFDYYKGNINLRDKKTIVFVSHGHGDHFNPKIFKWQNSTKDINYILSSDIKLDFEDENIHFMNPYETMSLGGVSIKTFGSTDLGVSFLINVDNINIFHGGDLNWWHWENNSIEENLHEEKIFKEEVEKIKGESIDIAFFPVDPRLGTAFYYGGEYFIEEIKPKIFIPMHFGDKFSITSDFIHRMKDNDTNIVEINSSNQKFTFS